MILMTPRFSLDPAFKNSDPFSEDEIQFEDIPINPQTVLNKGIEMIRLKKYEEAIDVFNRALKIDPEFSEAWYKKGETLNELGMNEEARECFNRVIKLEEFSQSIYSINRKGKALMMLGKSDEALECLSQLIELDKKNLLGSFKNIAKLWKGKVELEPENAEAWNNLGAILYKQNKYEDALISFNTSIKLNKNYSETWYNKGIVLAKLCDNEKALQCYEEAIKLNPLHAKAWFSKGNILNNAGNQQEAIKCYEEALDANPQYARAWYNKGLIHVCNSDYNNAIMSFEKAVEIDPKYTKAKIAKIRATLFMNNSTPISDLESGMFCCISGFVSSLLDVRKDIGEIAQFYISDGTGRIRFVLWDDQVKLINGIDLGCHIKVSDCYVKEGWNEPLVLGCTSKTKIEWSPEIISYPIHE